MSFFSLNGGTLSWVSASGGGNDYQGSDFFATAASPTSGSAPVFFSGANVSIPDTVSPASARGVVAALKRTGNEPGTLDFSYLYAGERMPQYPVHMELKQDGAQGVDAKYWRFSMCVRGTQGLQEAKEGNMISENWMFVSASADLTGGLLFTA